MEKETRLGELLRSFSAADHRRAGQFLQLPEVNRREDVRRLYELLRHSIGRKKAPNDAELFAQIYPNRPYDDQQLRLLRSYLFKCLERFLIFQECTDDTDTSDLLLLRAYQKRKLQRHLQSTLDRQEKRFRSSTRRPAETHLTRHLRERERATLLARGNRTAELNLQSVEDSLDRAFWAFKLRQACTSRSHERVVRTRYELRLIDEILAISKDDPTPAVAVYRSCYVALFKEPVEENFRNFRQLLTRHADCFPETERRSLYLLALNYCIRQINENQALYLREAFDLYRSGLDSGILLENGRLSSFTFANAAGIALRLGELQWTEQLLDRHAPALPPGERDTTIALNRARLHFARNEYADAQIALQAADTNDPINAMNARILQLKIYRKTQERQAYEHLLHASQRFVDRHRDSYHYGVWRNILHYLRRLHELNPHDDKARRTLYEEVATAEQLMERDWLLRELEL